MSNAFSPNPTPVVYQIRIKGHLDSQWTDWFEGMTITLEDNGDTVLTGNVIDQAALHGLLKQVRDLGMPLVSVNPVPSNKTNPDRSKKGEPLNMPNKPISEIPAKLSTLWIVVMFCIAYADIIGFIEPGTLEKIIHGNAEFELTPVVILVISLLQAIPITMIFVSRWLRRDANRWLNIFASGLTLLYVIGGGNWSSASYGVFVSLEVAAMLAIIWFSWNWHSQAQPIQP
jgi:hypothetical protein